MSKKKSKKKNSGPPKPMIQLSQCMIVKNEEKNIRKALGWASGVAFEQIVVDTGSTDRTVEIAAEMGAKVYHFEWVDDFAAAKNYAIEQATGNWIAFLDADEYFTSADTKEMMAALKRLYAEHKLRDKILAVNCPWVQLDDNGMPFGIDEQMRLFRNVPSVRYIGKIHERLSLVRENVVRSDKFSIMHTGYSITAYSETDKAERNISMLRKELGERPDELDLKVYLADSLRAKAREDGPGPGKASEDEAAVLYAEVAASDGAVESTLCKKAHLYTIERSLVNGRSVHECEGLCVRALRFFPGDLDFEYYYARVLRNKGDLHNAWELLRKCEASLMKASALRESDLISTKPLVLFVEMVYTAEALGDVAGTIKYATMVLMEDKTVTDILGPFIATLLKHGTPDDEVIALLMKIYDFSDPKDLIQIARAAKDRGAIGFSRIIAELAKEIIARS